MIGMLKSDEKGFVIETSYAMSNEPVLLVTRWRVCVMNGSPQRNNESVSFNGSWWNGYGFQCNTEQRAESTRQEPIKKPRGAKVYRDGEWHKR
jgi:hypothetical protein